VRAIAAFHGSPRAAAVYNIGGGRRSNCSMLEAIELCERIAGRELEHTISDEARVGDHRWWISDLSAFRRDYPEWDVRHEVPAILEEIYAENVERWTADRRTVPARR
jgi:CDP-paratose 2-epimerase